MKIFLLLHILLLCLTGQPHNPANGAIIQDSSYAEIQSVDYDLKIYPNPVENGKINLEIINDKITEIHLINIAGKEVLARKINSGTSKAHIELHNMPNGIYLVRVTTLKNNMFVKKLIVSSQ
jgi:hypothetical protein